MQVLVADCWAVRKHLCKSSGASVCPRDQNAKQPEFYFLKDEHGVFNAVFRISQKSGPADQL
jgi:hypothetical protein